MVYYEDDKVQIREAWAGLGALLGLRGTIVYAKKDRSQTFYLVKIDGVDEDTEIKKLLRDNPTNKMNLGFEWKKVWEQKFDCPLFRCIMRHLTLVSRPSRPASGAASGAPSGAASGAPSGAAGKRPVDEDEDPKGKRPKQ